MSHLFWPKIMGAQVLSALYLEKNTLFIKIRKQITSAINDFNMLDHGDKLMIAVSGGKDSSILALAIQDIQKHAKISFTFEAVLLDQKQPGFDANAYQAWMASQKIALTIITEDTYSIVKEKTAPHKSYCGLCSRLRRGILYNYATDHGFTKIALGHHRDDLNETLLMNMFFNGRVASMPPKLLSDDKRNIVIRPLCYVREEHLQKLAKELDFPIIPCNLCGSQENMQRQEMKTLLSKLESKHPGLGATLLNAQRNIRLSQMLDSTLWPKSIDNDNSEASF